MKKIIFTLTCMLIAVGCITSQAKVVEPVTKVKVKNEKEFMKALASNRVITVAKNTTLNLSKVLEDPALCNECNLVWVEEDYDHSQLSQFSTAASDYEFDGRMLTLMKLHNLTIEGEKNAEIVVNPRYAHVLNFEKCKGIRIKNLTLGHTEEGYCTGCVIGVSYSEDITIENCDLYGCGTYGIEARSTNGIEMKKSIIRDCSYGIMEIRDCKFVNFEKCGAGARRREPLPLHGPPPDLRRGRDRLARRQRRGRLALAAVRHAGPAREARRLDRLLQVARRPARPLPPHLP
ncbi:MAG: right-handed parallel beta-helix repeat-containing protein, partial [Muribaculaceae bacterium]|nr:right-handed parallel beta-helix repeat-containing protein [Muribaculaceae bacterium]